MKRKWIFLGPLAIVGTMYIVLGAITTLGAIYRHWRRGSAAPVELALAVAFRLAPDHLLAGTRSSHTLPNSLRRIRNARFRPFRLAPSHG